MAVRFFPATHILKLVLIRLALDSPPEMVTNAFHEAFHDLELHLFRQHELDLMIRETPRLRQIVRDRFGYTQAEVEGMAGSEIRAQAFEIYATDRARGGRPGATPPRRRAA